MIGSLGTVWFQTRCFLFSGLISASEAWCENHQIRIDGENFKTQKSDKLIPSGKENNEPLWWNDVLFLNDGPMMVFIADILIFFVYFCRSFEKRDWTKRASSVVLLMLPSNWMSILHSLFGLTMSWHHLSNFQKAPGCLGYLRNERLPSSVGIALPETNIAMENPQFWWYLPGKMGFSWATLVSGRVFHKPWHPKISSWNNQAVWKTHGSHWCHSWADTITFYGLAPLLQPVTAHRMSMYPPPKFNSSPLKSDRFTQ